MIGRAVDDGDLPAQIAGEIRRLFPACPAERAEAMARHMAARGSGRIGRTSAARALDPDAIELAVIASIRHVDTGYDALLMSGVERDAARAQAQRGGPDPRPLATRGGPPRVNRGMGRGVPLLVRRTRFGRGDPWRRVDLIGMRRGSWGSRRPRRAESDQLERWRMQPVRSTPESASTSSPNGCSGRGERSHTARTDLFVPAAWSVPLRVIKPAGVTGGAG